jgi:hypothetical protein
VSYEQIAKLVSSIRNAKFGQMVAYVEQLIDAEDWRDFSTPVGTHFVFHPKEFDYFLAAQDLDPTTIRHAYAHAKDVEEMVAKRIRLADVTGRGAAPQNGDRRAPNEAASAYDGDPSGAGGRIRAWHQAKAIVVTDATSRAARHPERRKALLAGDLPSPRPRRKWGVEWEDERSTAEMIAARLMKDPELAHEVYKILDAAESRRRYDQTRRSEG